MSAHPPADEPFDFFVIGAGSGGVRAARIAAQHGARVGIAESSRYGGTCVIRGCVPKKLLVLAGRFRDAFDDSRGFGWNPGDVPFEWPTLLANKNREIDRLERAYAGNLDKAGVQRFGQHARLDGPGRVALADGTVLRARHILIATGGHPERHDTLPGAVRAITSDEALELAQLPDSMVIAGGGYIAVEFASLFAHLGVRVTLVHRGPRLLRGFDVELAERLGTALRGRGLDLRLGRTLASVDDAGQGGRLAVRLRADGGEGTDEVVETGALMLALGRRPNIAGLGLQTVGIEPGHRGEIRVDGQARTGVDGIYAIGDVTGTVALTPVAIRQGHALADSLFGPQPWTADLGVIPTAVFSTPELGSVGLTQEQACEQHPYVDVYRAEFRSMRAALAGSDERVLMKLLVQADTGRLLGAHMSGPEAAEMIQLIATLLQMGATKTDFDRTMPLHPSAAEEWMTMRTPAERIRRPVAGGAA